MEQNINTNLDMPDEVCNDMKIMGSDFNIGDDKQWEMNLINDMTMSDITRAVNAFITKPGSSTLDCIVPKKEKTDQDLSEDLLGRSNSNSNENSNEIVGYNTLESGSVLANTFPLDRMHSGQPISYETNIDSYINNHIFENRIVHEGASFPKTDNASKIIGIKNILTTMDRRPNETTSNNIITKPNFNTHPFLRSLTGGVMLIKPSVVVVESNTAKGVEVISGELQLDSGHSSTSMVSKATSIPKVPRRRELTQQRAHQNLHVCPIKDCNVRVSSKEKLNIHVRTNHKLEGFQCLKCSKRYATVRNFEQHQNLHKGIKPYKCKICGKNFEISSVMYAHFRGHDTSHNNKAQCDICGVVGCRTSLSTHIKVVHLKERYQCKECKREFRTTKILKDHIRMHRGEEPYKCEICPQTFVQKKSMLRHFKRHFRKLQCPKCDKVFTCHRFLQGHLLLHDGIKKHCCNVCGKTFTHSHYLFTHMKSHGEKLFECAICGGKFNRKDNLKSHIIRHQTTGRTNLKKK